MSSLCCCLSSWEVFSEHEIITSAAVSLKNKFTDLATLLRVPTDVSDVKNSAVRKAATGDAAAGARRPTPLRRLSPTLVVDGFSHHGSWSVGGGVSGPHVAALPGGAHPAQLQQSPAQSLDRGSEERLVSSFNWLTY